MSFSAQDVKELREKTGAGMMDCKRALSETNGDKEKAVAFLRQKGLADAGKRSGRSTSEGQAAAYIHPGGKIGVLVEVNCETDFVARNADFQEFVRNVAMHIAAANPQYVRREEVPASAVEREREVFVAQARESGKPPAVIEKIVQGRVDKWYAEVCLLDQPFVKDTDKTIGSYMKDMIARIGENIQVRRFSRYQVGEEASGAAA